ncbi:hypothetical protein OV203_27440 [Nannocystis sp. ILAH1]|uniref:hypothetical protein n=1 Tax=unclassified Nannocystis TaxID=2627009 RepID=UPI00226ECB18|nr:MULTISPECIES: hypothetical protein [unclassified Nannocystis]MCY0990909.1 hypothetical protein [Nannocystis sp. ILAH1]MCY1064412.1 hypothetical protein [Nannocystis sp. RBIL2]
MAANDQFARYFTEKLWDWIPGVYRELDAAAPNQHVLRALIQAVAEQAAVARRSIDRLWEDQSIEYCDDWVVPYIGDLVATRLVPALNARARRVDVARTIYYRRRAGTVTVLERLILDMAGWDGAVVEAFRRLGRTHHGLDPQPYPVGRLTATPVGGIADLRRQRGVELAHGTFDELSHTADLWQHRGHAGRYAIPKLNHHLYRMQAYRVDAPTPFELTTRRYTFDPSGRDIPLFRPSYRPEDGCRRRLEEDVSAPIRCRLLGHAEYEITDAVLEAMVGVLLPASRTELRDWIGVRFRDEYRLRATLNSLANGADFTDPDKLHRLLAAALTEDSAKAALVRDARAFKITRLDDTDDVQIAPERTLAGDLGNWGTGLSVAIGKQLMVDPVRGRYWFPEAAFPAGTKVAHYYYGFSGDLGAGTYDRRATVLTNSDGFFNDGNFDPPVTWANVYTFDDSKTYLVDDVADFTDLTLQAASQRRPYLRRATTENTDWKFTADGTDAELTLDGLWYGGGRLVLAGDYARVTIRHCTLDPGGVRADSIPLVPADIFVQGTIDELVIESSIVAGITLGVAGAVHALRMRDSIVASTAATSLVHLPQTELEFARCTLAIATTGLRIDATELLAQKPVKVTDHQRGCVRYSVLAPGSETSPVYPPPGVAEVFPHFFVSTRFGDPGFYVLSESAPDFVVRGAESGSEIGAYSRLLNPLKHDSVRAKVHEFMPMGRIAAFIREN